MGSTISAPGTTVDELVERHPRLFHTAAAGSWPSISRHGLLPTAELVHTSGLPEQEQSRLLSTQRRRPVVLEHPVHGRVTLRDQSPLRPERMAALLTDVTLAQWIGMLNERVFFWLHERRLRNLLQARRNRSQAQDVLTLDTASLVRAHLDAVRLSPMNSGSALYPNAPGRGSTTFVRLSDYPYAERRRTRGAAGAVVELAVLGGVPDLARHVVGVDRYVGAEWQHAIVGRPV